MRFNEFERDSLINFGKKHGYITEGMTDEQIDEILPAVGAAARAGAKAIGTAAKAGIKGAKAGVKAGVKGAKAGVKAAAPVVQKGVKAAGAGLKQAGGAVKNVAQQAGKAVKGAVDQAGGVGQIAQNVGQAASAGLEKVKGVAGQAADAFKQAQDAAAQNALKGADDQWQPDPKATQKVAQRATALKSIAGGKASGGMVAKGLDKVGQGTTLPPNLIKAIQPYTQSIQTIMQDPQLFSRFKMLMKQAKASQGQAQQ